MMKKLLMMAAIAALSSSAWANISYRVQIDDIDKGTGGLLPTELQVKLVDKLGSKSATHKSVLTQDAVNLIQTSAVGKNKTTGDSHEFTQIELEAFLVEGGRMNVKSLLENYKEVSFKTSKGQTVLLTYDTNLGYQAVYEDRSLDTSDVFGSLPSQDWGEYAENNLKTVLSVGDESLKPIVTTLNSGASQLGATATLAQVVPEPTSGMLALLGVMGLMLRRRRAA